MEQIRVQVQSLAREADEATRYQILKDLRNLETELESPMDLFLKLYNSHLQLAIVYVGVETQIFSQLAENGTHDLTAHELAGKSGASPELFDRLLRYLASIGYISNPSGQHYGANKTTVVLASPIARAGITHAFDTCGPAIQALPVFLSKTSYQDISSNTHTPFQQGHNTPLSAFAYLQTQPKLFNALQTVMGGLQSSDWIEGLDVLDREAKSASSQGEVERPFFVDVGGGHGHQCVQFLKRYPHLKGRVILQDLPEAVDRLSSSSSPLAEGIHTVAQDFFAPQPSSTKGAKFFYLRRVLHDWPDDDCVKILTHLKDAMSSAPAESRILIDEVVLPDVDAPWQAVMQDVSMGILFAGKERTRTQWGHLTARIEGLAISEVRTYSSSSCNSVIVLEKV